ncbi:amidohydrolase 2 [Mytilinidion resinicola]|uniref:6-methylsalicylate decarboxylase n=1 Tax=Mytilinidion resinicola TaxID=574789 RepID=A0A6A6Z7B1_9PEZI|nr:amidohydrolase 2 [Mytilinidion resinicola]KAF2816563.1 amidohydrolase 2 [Mytilinidion resinicola]
MGEESQLPPRIDVHSHFLPPEYCDELRKNGHSKPDGMPAIPTWSLAGHLEMMSKANVTKSILSISSPGTNINANDNALNIRLTRFCNSYAASLKRDHPDKIGYWAALPLPDIDATFEEIKKAKEEGADGFGLLTNYHGNYLGSDIFDPVFQELDRLKARVFIHPTMPCVICQTSTSEPPTLVNATPLAAKHPIPIYEFFFDTARAVTNLFLSGTVARCPNIRFIIPHSGGCLPPVISRFIGFSSIRPAGPVMIDQEVRGAIARQFYFDLAGFVFAGEKGGSGQLKALLEGYNIDHRSLLYGSDFPFTQTPLVKNFADRMKDGLEDLFNEEEREEIYEKNATALLAE